MKSLLIFLIFLGTLASCKKYLDKKRDTSLSTPETIADLQALLNNPGEMNLKRTPSYQEGSSDDYFILDATLNSRPEIQRMLYKWEPFEYSYGNDWDRTYKSIYIANLCLDQLKRIDKTASNEVEWNLVKGCALFNRAYSFLHLAWVHSKSFNNSTSTTDLGIVLRLTSDFNVVSTRANVKQTYDQIVSDIKESVQYLQGGIEHVTRPSRVAAYSLLARTYLSMREYDSAFRYSNLTLSLKNDLIDYKTVTNSLTPFTSFVHNGEAIFYTEMYDGLAGGLLTQSRHHIDTTLFSTYAPTDLRKTLFFEPRGNYHFFKGSYSIDGSARFTGTTTAEMYLIKAECFARGTNGVAPDKDAALNVLNTLLTKRHNNGFLGASAATAQEALDLILSERRKELVFRGLRWMDIKRLNQEGRGIILTRLIGGVTHTLDPNSNFYALPIPTDIVNMTGMPQNPL